MEREEMVLDAVRELYQDFDLVVCLAKNSNVLNIKAQEHNWFLNYPIGLWISDYDVKLGEERREIQKQFFFNPKFQNLFSYTFLLSLLKIHDLLHNYHLTQE